jgi:membrane fusion protein, multidrug efflux system
MTIETARSRRRSRTRPFLIVTLVVLLGGLGTTAWLARLSPTDTGPVGTAAVEAMKLLGQVSPAAARLVADFVPAAAAADKAGGTAAEKPAARAPRTAPVTVAIATKGDIPEVEQTIGTVVAAATVQVKSRIDGQIMTAGFVEGQHVRKGDLLFRIDPRPFEAALAAAEAMLMRDRAQLENAKADLTRYTDLSSKGYSPAQRFDLAQAQAKALEATVKADESAIQIARLNLGYTEIRAPIDGKTGALLVSVGNLVKANDTVSLVVITQDRPVKISFTLPQQALPKLQTRLGTGDLKVEVSIPGDTRPPAAGTVDFIGSQVDAAAGTIELRATIDNDDGRLVPGQFVDVGLRLTLFRDVVSIPREAINIGQKGRYAYVVKADQSVEMRPVEIAYENDRLAVVAKGVAAGEKVVTDGQLRLMPGMKVTIQGAGGGTS